jgi:hypothetical protein
MRWASMCCQWGTPFPHPTTHTDTHRNTCTCSTVCTTAGRAAGTLGLILNVIALRHNFERGVHECPVTKFATLPLCVPLLQAWLEGGYYRSMQGLLHDASLNFNATALRKRVAALSLLVRCLQAWLVGGYYRSMPGLLHDASLIFNATAFVITLREVTCGAIHQFCHAASSCTLLAGSARGRLLPQHAGAAA